MLNSVLLIEDSSAEHYLYTKVLKSYNENVEIFAAFDGQEGLYFLVEKKVNPDVILLDINMPGMDGFEFLESYVTHDQLKECVIVMLTSSDHERDKDRAFSYGCVKDYILKPLSLDNIDTLVKAAQ